MASATGGRDVVVDAPAATGDPVQRHHAFRWTARRASPARVGAARSFAAWRWRCAGVCRSRRPDERTRLPAEAIAIAMVVDVSGSMDAKVAWAAGEPPVSRLEAARKAFKLFVFGGEAPDGTKFEPTPLRSDRAHHIRVDSGGCLPAHAEPFLRVAQDGG